MRKSLIALILPISALLWADSNTTVKNLDSNMTESNSTIVTGTTIGHYQKPGAPVDMRYTTRKIRAGEISDVNISLMTPLKSGEMEVSISFDKELTPVDDIFDKVVFQIVPDQKEYKLHFRVTSSKDGLYYIRLLIHTRDPNGDSANMRAFAIPVYVGSGQLIQKSRQKIMKALSGENLSVSKAKETIKVLSD